MTEISAEAFLGVNETLQELRIINSKLARFPKEAVSVLGSLVLLVLDNHGITDLPKDLFADSMLPNNLEKFYISNGNVSNIETETFQVNMPKFPICLNLPEYPKLSQSGLQETKSVGRARQQLDSTEEEPVQEPEKLGGA